MRISTCGFAGLVFFVILARAPAGLAVERVVRNSDELRTALNEARAGDEVVLAPGIFAGGVTVAGLTGTADAPIVIRGQDPENPPLIEGGGEALHLVRPRHVVLRDIQVRGQANNGINIDDGGDYTAPAHHVLVENVGIRNIGSGGNQDGLKLSGLYDFVVRGLHVDGWSGSAVDMVGCHRGRIETSVFVGREQFSPASAIQIKGGSSDIEVFQCFFDHAGPRPINLGGSTGLRFFRPPAAGFEATRVTVAGNRFAGGETVVAFPTASGGIVRHNTIYRPDRWVLRILQETANPDFQPSHGGVWEQNLVLYDGGLSRFVNIGPNTAPETFTFRGNAWFGVDGPRSVELPVPEVSAVYQIDPQLEDAGAATMRIGSDATVLGGVGADAFRGPARYPDAASLNGPYHYVRLEIPQSGPASTATGTLTLDGLGGLSYSAPDGPAPASVNAAILEDGRYRIEPDGRLSLDHPLGANARLAGSFTRDGSVLFASTYSGAGTRVDFLFAVLAGLVVTPENLSGVYKGAFLGFPEEPGQVRSGLATLVFDGQGAFSGSIQGHERGAGYRDEAFANGAFGLNRDGTGTLSMGSGVSLLASERAIWVSTDGNYLASIPLDGSPDLLIAARTSDNDGSPVSQASGRYLLAGLGLTGDRVGASSGSIRFLPGPGSAGTVLSALRRTEAGVPTDRTGIELFDVTGGRGWIGDRSMPGTENVVLGRAKEGSTTASVLVGGQTGSQSSGQPGKASVQDSFGLFFAVAEPDGAGGGFHLKPSGVAHAASFAGPPNPVAPGMLVSLFGGGFQDDAGLIEAGSLPLPRDLGRISATVNGVSAGLLHSNTGQANIQIPYGLTGESAVIRLTRTYPHYAGTRNAAFTRELTVPLAPTSPGVFFYGADFSDRAGIITHAGGELVTPDHRARPGETVVIYLTGLGELDPAVPTGEPNPGLSGDPPAHSIDANIEVWFNGRPGAVRFAGGTPGFAGLNQINATISPDTPPAAAAPVRVRTSNAIHEGVYIPIGPDPE